MFLLVVILDHNTLLFIDSGPLTFWVPLTSTSLELKQKMTRHEFATYRGVGRKKDAFSLTRRVYRTGTWFSLSLCLVRHLMTSLCTMSLSCLIGFMVM